MITITRSLLILFVVACSSAFAGDVHYVASDGTGDFLTVADAYAAADDGDVLLVTRQGNTSGIQFNTKGVTLINFDDNWVVPRLEVANLPDTSHVVLRGLHLDANHGAEFRDCDGPIVLSSSDGCIANYGPGNLTIENCAAVSIRHSNLALGYGYVAASPMANGIYLENSNLLVDNSSLAGANGAWGYSGGFCMTCCLDGGAGTTALTLRSGSVARIQSSVLSGGSGGNTYGIYCVDGVPSMAVNLDASSAATSVASTLIGPLVSPGVVELQDPPRTFQTPSSLEAGSSFVTRAVGPIGETIFVLVGVELGFVPISPTAGVLQITQSAGRRRLGSIPPGAAALFTFQAPPIPAGTVRSVPIQAAFLDASGQVRFAPADYLEFRGAGVPAW